jgi:hypothetical protein
MNIKLNQGVTQPSHFIINSKDNERILEIKSNGDTYFRINGDVKKIECEKDLSLMFVAVIAELTGLPNNIEKDKLFSEIIKNYRDSKIGKILN